MKRPIVVILLGYIIGIIVGLYLNISIVSIYIPATIIYLLNKLLIKHKKSQFKNISFKRYIRYIKIYINSQVILTIIISSIISNSIVLFQNIKYSKMYKILSEQENINISGIVVSQKQEKKYYDRYKIKTNYNNKKINLYINTSKKQEFKYGDKIQFSGNYILPEEERNYKGFNYREYLKQIKVYGTIKVNKIDKIDENQGNKILLISNNIYNRIQENTYKVLDKETASIFLGLMLGNKDNIEEETQENFRNSSMSHILAVSGMHIGYIILGLSITLKNKLGKRKTNITIIFILVIYMFLSRFTPSVTRAGIMGILLIMSKIIHRKNDIYTSISTSLLIILINNSFLIQNMGLMMSYGGTMGIIFFHKSIFRILQNIDIKNKTYKYLIKPKIEKILNKLKDIIALSISVQIVILPIIIVNLNIFSPYFLISNLLLSFIIAPIVIIGFIFIIVVLINSCFANIITKPIIISIKLLENISYIGKLPFSKIYIPTPKIFWVLIYYFVIIIIFYLYTIYSSKKPTWTQIRVKNLIALLKIKLREKNKKIKKCILLILITLIILTIMPENLRIYFVDVGQGDCTLIKTPYNKTVLIDGGGSVNSDYDVGKNTLLPYILDRGINKIDIIVVSHFDNDHIGGLLYVMEEIKVKKLIIGKQFETCENYEKFKNIVKEKKIEVKIVEAGQRINIENNLYFDVLWPTSSDVITENSLNNNSLVCKLIYKNFSILFTGDIEKIAEDKILKKYKNRVDILNADILKVAHHGSKTSSTIEFLNAVNPKIAIIGVGKNNNFGHPSYITLENLKKLNCKIYRTDENGEISIKFPNMQIISKK